MKFKSLIKGLANASTQMLIGQPIFAQEKAEPILPANTSNKIIGAIAIVEKLTENVPAMLEMKGTDKLAAATELVLPVILQSSALAGAEVEDQERFTRGVSKITDGWNDVIKSVKKKKV